jgi:hypothetical protein
MHELHLLKLTALAELIRMRKISPVEIVRYQLPSALRRGRRSETGD